MNAKLVSGTLFFVVAALPYVAMFWSGEEESASLYQGAEQLRIMSPHRREVRLEYSRGFRDWMNQRHGRDVRVEWLDAGGTSKMLKDLESRFAARPESPGVDLLFGGGVDPYFQAADHGWLAPAALAGGVPAAIPALCAGSPVYDGGNRWFGVALSGFGILYNKVLIERLGLPTPVTWEDLARPELFSWIGSGDPRSSGSVHMCYEIILQAYGFEEGWRLITRICANVRRFGEGGGTVPREVASGEVAAGMVIDQYGRTVIDEIGGGALEFVLPKGATVIGADAIGLVTNAPARDLAVLFIEYCLSEEGQRLLFQPAGVNGQKHALHRMPVLSSLYTGPHAPAASPYAYEGGFVYDQAKGGVRWRIVNDLIGTCLIDSHADLTRAWQALLTQGVPAAGLAELVAPPVTEPELEALADQWSDSRIRLDVMREWADEAGARYRRILDETAGSQRVGD
jgi:ABC-type Fe3+ transport system substrate-binding protein